MTMSRHTHGSTIPRLAALRFGDKKVCVAAWQRAYTSNYKENLQLSL